MLFLKGLKHFLMDRQAILQRMGEIIADINEQYESLKTHPGKADQLEMELFEANIKFLADHTQILKRLNASPEEIPVMEEEKKIIAVLDEIAESEEPEMPQEVAEEDPVWVHEERQVVEDKVVVTVFKDEEVAINDTEQPKPTINDLMIGRASANLAAKLSQEPLKDLKVAISLNDKLVFVKDLFSGYSLAYAEAIDVLNKLETFEAADQYLKTNYISQHKWTEKQATADRFYELLNRRFTK
jgi:hypothetical protein